MKHSACTTDANSGTPPIRMYISHITSALSALSCESINYLLIGVVVDLQNASQACQAIVMPVSSNLIYISYPLSHLSMRASSQLPLKVISHIKTKPAVCMWTDEIYLVFAVTQTEDDNK